MSTWTSIIFRAVITDIFDMRVSPKGTRLSQESFHYMEYVNVGEDCDA